MMKKNLLTTLFALPFFALLMVACNDNGKPAVSGSITLAEQSKTSHTLAAADTTVTVAFNTTDAWSATADAQWITISPKSGNAADVSMTITVSANPSATEARSGKIRVICGQSDLVITITQNKAEIVPEPEIKHLISKMYILGENVDTIMVIHMTYNDQGQMITQSSRAHVDQLDGDYRIYDAVYVYSPGKIITTIQNLEHYSDIVEKSTSTATAMLNSDGMIDTYQLLMSDQIDNMKFEYTDGYLTKVTNNITTLYDNSTQTEIETYTWKDGSMIKSENSTDPRLTITAEFDTPPISNNLAGNLDISASRLARASQSLSIIGHQGIMSKYAPSKITQSEMSAKVSYQFNDKGLVSQVSITYPESTPEITYLEYTTR